MNDMITVAEYAIAHSVSRAAVYGWIAARRIKARWIDGRQLVPAHATPRPSGKRMGRPKGSGNKSKKVVKSS